MHRPSAEKLWQMPAATVVPSAPGFAPRSEPLDVHATSYFALSVRISSFFIKSIVPTSKKV